MTVVMGAGGLGERIQQARAQAGLSQRELARKAGVSLKALYKWEHGAQPLLRNVHTIARVTGVSVEWLLTGEEETTDLEREVRDLRTVVEALTERIDELLSRPPQGPQGS